MNKKQLYRLYKENEDLNSHSENLLLLAKNFGTEEEIREAENQVRGHQVDAPPYDMPRYMFKNINEYYYKHLVEYKHLEDLELDDRLREIEDVAHGEAGTLITLLRKDLNKVIDK
jgi:hypothetical protein